MQRYYSMGDAAHRVVYITNTEQTECPVHGWVHSHQNVLRGRKEMLSYSVIVGATIRKMRLSVDVASKDLAKECDKSSAWMSKIERAETTLSVDNLKTITSALGVSMEDFFKEVTREAHEPGIPIRVELYPREMQRDKYTVRNIGQTIQSDRTAAGLSIEALANMVGITPKLLVNIENGALDESTIHVYVSAVRKTLERYTKETPAEEMMRAAMLVRSTRNLIRLAE